MKHRILLGAALLSLATFAQADTLCQQKEQAIQHQIDIASQHNNSHRVSGLKRALSESQAHCSDESLKKSHQDKINQHQQKVAEREQELKQEQAEGSDPEKIAKRERKLADAQRELKEVQAAPY